MSQYVATPTRSLTAGGAIAQHLRVKLSGGKLVAAGVGEVELGTMAQASDADNDVRGVYLSNAQGTVKMVAAGAITLHANVYGAAGGKVDDAVNGNYIGLALEAATADGDIIEVLRLTQPDAAALIADPTGGATVDTEARAAINDILNILETAGLMKSA